MGQILNLYPFFVTIGLSNFVPGKQALSFCSFCFLQDLQSHLADECSVKWRLAILHIIFFVLPLLQ